MRKDEQFITAGQKNAIIHRVDFTPSLNARSLYCLYLKTKAKWWDEGWQYKWKGNCQRIEDKVNEAWIQSLLDFTFYTTDFIYFDAWDNIDFDQSQDNSEVEL